MGGAKVLGTAFIDAYMPEFEFSEEQHEALERVRSDLEKEHVGRYGHVRKKDALQFLLDRYAIDNDRLLLELIEESLAGHSYQELQRLAGMLEDVQPTGAEPELRRAITVAIGEEFLDITEVEGLVDAGERPPVPDPGGSRSEDEQTADVMDPPGADENATPESKTADAETKDGPSRLQQMMGMLDHHSDLWEESNDDDGKYSVELPDGTTEVVRTKDDVRAVLFREYT